MIGMSLVWLAVPASAVPLPSSFDPCTAPEECALHEECIPPTGCDLEYEDLNGDGLCDGEGQCQARPCAGSACPPLVTSMVPEHGYKTGNTEVIVTGMNFLTLRGDQNSDSTRVNFHPCWLWQSARADLRVGLIENPTGPLQPGQFRIDSDTQMTILTPPCNPNMHGYFNWLDESVSFEVRNRAGNYLYEFTVGGYPEEISSDASSPSEPPSPPPSQPPPTSPTLPLPPPPPGTQGYCCDWRSGEDHTCKPQRPCNYILVDPRFAQTQPDECAARCENAAQERGEMFVCDPEQPVQQQCIGQSIDDIIEAIEAGYAVFGAKDGCITACAGAAGQPPVNPPGGPGVGAGGGGEAEAPVFPKECIGEPELPNAKLLPTNTNNSLRVRTTMNFTAAYYETFGSLGTWYAWHYGEFDNYARNPIYIRAALQDVEPRYIACTPGRVCPDGTVCDQSRVCVNVGRSTDYKIARLISDRSCNIQYCSCVKTDGKGHLWCFQREWKRWPPTFNPPFNPVCDLPEGGFLPLFPQPNFGLGLVGFGPQPNPGPGIVLNAPTFVGLGVHLGQPVRLYAMTFPGAGVQLSHKIPYVMRNGWQVPMPVGARPGQRIVYYRRLNPFNPAVYLQGVW